MTLQQELSAKQSNPDTQAKVISVSADMDNAADMKKSISSHDRLIAHTRHAKVKKNVEMFRTKRLYNMSDLPNMI